MKSITLVRHGKSSWEFDVIDRERPLKLRGKKDAQLVAKAFLNQNEVPKNIFSSPATRALSTCKIFTEIFNLSQNSIQIEDDLYDFSGENVIKFIKNLPPQYNDVMIFGHNHAFTSIANIYGDKIIENLPTSGLIKLKFAINDWTALKPGISELIIFPRDLRND